MSVPLKKPSCLEKCPGSRSLGEGKNTLLVLVTIVCKLTSSDRVKGLPRWLSGKKSACYAGYMGSIRGSGRSPGEGNDNPLQYSCLENPLDREAWQATVHGVARVRHNLATKRQQQYRLYLKK